MNDPRAERDEHWLMLAFRSPAPPLARLPHCLMRPARENLSIVLQTFASSGGIFGDYPFVDETGGPYLEPENGEITDDFHLWELPENQERVLDHGCHARLGAFSMVIDSRTPPALLARLYRLCLGEDDGTDTVLEYYDSIQRIAGAFPELGWAYIPLGEDCDYAMLVGPEAAEAHIRSVEATVRLAGEATGRLRPVGESFAWDLSTPS